MTSYSMTNLLNSTQKKNMLSKIVYELFYKYQFSFFIYITLFLLTLALQNLYIKLMQKKNLSSENNHIYKLNFNFTEELLERSFSPRDSIALSEETPEVQAYNVNRQVVSNCIHFT